MSKNVLLIPFLAAALAPAQVLAGIEASLIKIGHIVDPACTAKPYRPLMPKNDISSNVTPLYPGITIARDVSFSVTCRACVQSSNFRGRFPIFPCRAAGVRASHSVRFNVMMVPS
jgi:hypothetical protein